MSSNAVSRFFSWAFGGSERRILAEAEHLRQTFLEEARATEAVLRRIEDRTSADSQGLRDDLSALAERMAGIETIFRADRELTDQRADQVERMIQTQGETLGGGLSALDARVEAMARETEARQWAPKTWLTDRLGGRFPTFLGDDGRILANPHCSDRPSVAIISIPKAGTYLVDLLLERLGYRSSELHLSQTFLTDYRRLSIADKRGKSFEDHLFHLPIETSAILVGEGQFVVGHLHAETRARVALFGFRKLFLYRNLVDSTLSHMRFLIEAGRAPVDAAWATMEASPDQALAFLADKGAELVEGSYRPLLGWLDDADVFAISFETLAGDIADETRAARLRELAAFLGVDKDLGAVLAAEVLGQPTKTLSSGRTQADVYLNDAVRQAFRDLGVDELHARLGYPPV